MNAELIVEDVIALLEKRFGKASRTSRGRVLTFGSALTCSISYSKLLGGHKYFYAVPRVIIDPKQVFPQTKFGEFVVLICGSREKTLFLPRDLMLQMMSGVPTRRVDVFVESGSYILQTTKHPKIEVSAYMNAYPAGEATQDIGQEQKTTTETFHRAHTRIQWALITLGRAEGCSVWVPPNDRNLAHESTPFAGVTVNRLPNLGTSENTRRIIHNIDVLWLAKNVILKAFEIEATTSIYSGLLRLNDLVLAQPNIQINLYLTAPASRRDKVRDQMFRPSFQSLLPTCRFLSFETVEDQVGRLDRLSVDSGVRVSGLIKGEAFDLPDHYVYPSGL